MSQARAISRPPAKQYPLIAAMMGFHISRLRVIPPSPGSLSAFDFRWIAVVLL